MIIKITCHKCGCSFELCSNGYVSREAISCPNCGKALPVQISERITTALSALSEIPECYPEGSNTFSPDVEFSFNFSTKSEELPF